MKARPFSQAQAAPGPRLPAEAGPLAGRHLFRAPEAAASYARTSTEETAEERLTRLEGLEDGLARLALLMVELGRSEIGDEPNPNIPAGYTYLAQLVAHDVVHHTTSLAANDVGAPDLSGDRRIEPLVLETIYGGGPWANPHAYAVPPGRGDPRYRLRLGTIQGAPLVDPTEPPRDIPRIVCPHLNDAAYGGHSRDVLIADPRNDDNLILSQLTVVFHLLHNLVVDRLRIANDPQVQAMLNDDRAQVFLIGRRVVARVYRDIVVGDLLEKLLYNGVFSYYHPRLGLPQFFDDSDDRRVPLEFAFGVYRFGHAMIRRSYPLNDRLGRTGLTDVLLQTSENRAAAMPLTADWLIQWSHFFDLRPEVAREPEGSRKLGPSVVAALTRTVEPDRASRGGLAFEDLRSGAAAGLRSVTSMIKEFQDRGADHLFPDSRLYGDQAARASVIRGWLQEVIAWLEQRGVVIEPARRLEPRHIEAIANDPPLLFFVLLEAELVGGGDRLGPLGSLIVAESLLPLLGRMRARIEGDDDVEAAADRVFGQGRWPDTMPALLKFLADNLDLARPEARFL